MFVELQGFHVRRIKKLPLQGLFILPKYNPCSFPQTLRKNLIF
jgi:hypothetical protein